MHQPLSEPHEEIPQGSYSSFECLQGRCSCSSVSACIPGPSLLPRDANRRNALACSDNPYALLPPPIVLVPAYPGYLGAACRAKNDLTRLRCGRSSHLISQGKSTYQTIFPYPLVFFFTVSANLHSLLGTCLSFNHVIPYSTLCHESSTPSGRLGWRCSWCSPSKRSMLLPDHCIWGGQWSPWPAYGRSESRQWQLSCSNILHQQRRYHGHEWTWLYRYSDERCHSPIPVRPRQTTDVWFLDLRRQYSLPWKFPVLRLPVRERV